MLLKNDSFEIEIKVAEKFTKESVDKGGYDFIYNPVDFDFAGDFMKYYDISVKSADGILKIALIGDYYIYEEDCAVFENGILTLLLEDEIARIDVKTGKFLSFIKLDIYGLGEKIYKIPGRYIIKGELQIVFLNENFEKTGDFSARDIFHCTDGKNPFVICEDRIKVFDFLDDYFEIDFDGKLIKEEINPNVKW